jgi:Arc/MetJ-type ribon-helix-helix transcriptional regulator
MEIEISPEQNDLIRLGIEQGRYRDSAEAIQHALNLWVERERSRLELLASLDEAVESIEAGDGDITLNSEEEIAQYVEDISRRGRARLAALSTERPATL